MGSVRGARSTRQVSRCLKLLAAFLHRPSRCVQGVADALVGADGLAVDAVGVDLEQHGDAVPGAAGDLSGGHPGVEP